MNHPPTVLADAASPELDRDAEAYDAMERRITEALSDQFDEACRRAPWLHTNPEPGEPTVYDIAEIIDDSVQSWTANLIVATCTPGRSADAMVRAMLYTARPKWIADPKRRARMRSTLRLRDVQGFEP